MELAGLCDVRICGKKSRFGVPISKLGLVMGYHEIDALRSLVGAGPALKILLEGRVFDAEEAPAPGPPSVTLMVMMDADAMPAVRPATANGTNSSPF